MLTGVMCVRHPEVSWVVEGEEEIHLIALLTPAILHLALHDTPETKVYTSVDKPIFIKEVAHMIYGSQTYGGVRVATLGMEILQSNFLLYRWVDTQKTLFANAVRVEI